MKTGSAYMENQRSIPLHPPLARAFGDRQALMLQQIRYWMSYYQNAEERLPEHQRPHYRDGRWWVFNRYEDWKKDNFDFWSEGTIRRLVLDLENQGVLLSEQFNKSSGDKTKWYTIDFDALDRAVEAIAAERAHPSDQNDLMPPPSDQTDPTIGSNCADDEIKLRRSYKESESTTETTSQNAEQTPPPFGNTANANEGEGSGDGGGEAENGSEIQNLPIDCTAFLVGLNGLLGEKVRAMTPELQLAWWYEVQNGRDPAGLLAYRLRDENPQPLPVNLRKAREVLAGRVELVELVTAVGESAQQMTRLVPDESVSDLVPGSRVLLRGDIWVIVKTQLQAQLNSGTFAAYVKRSYAQSYADGVLTVCAYTGAARDWLTQRAADLEAQALRQTGQAVRLRFVLEMAEPVAAVEVAASAVATVARR